MKSCKLGLYCAFSWHISWHSMHADKGHSLRHMASCLDQENLHCVILFSSRLLDRMKSCKLRLLLHLLMPQHACWEGPAPLIETYGSEFILTSWIKSWRSMMVMRLLMAHCMHADMEHSLRHLRHIAGLNTVILFSIFFLLEPYLDA